jgi:cell division protein FtsW
LKAFAKAPIFEAVRGVERAHVSGEEIADSLRFYTANLAWLVCGITIFGLIMGYSASSTKLISEGLSPLGDIMPQFVTTAIGFAALFLISMMRFAPNARDLKMRLIVKFSYWLSIAALVFVYIQGDIVNGSRRALTIFGVQFQPTELAKFALVAYILYFLIVDARSMSTVKEATASRFDALAAGIPIRISKTGFAMIAAAALIALVLFQPNLGGAIYLFVLALVTFALCGAKKRWLALAAAVVAVPALLLLFLPNDYFSHARVRLAAWQNPFGEATASGRSVNADADKESYQIIQSLGAVANGGLFGRGLFQGIQKINRLPESKNDFIFAVICEELGLLGALLVIGGYLALLYFSAGIALCIRNPFYSGLVFLIGFGIVLQAGINMAAAVNLVPTTGINLPLISFGGSSKIVTLAELGLVLAVANSFLKFESPKVR